MPPLGSAVTSVGLWEKKRSKEKEKGRGSEEKERARGKDGKQGSEGAEGTHHNCYRCHSRCPEELVACLARASVAETPPNAPPPVII